MSVLGQMGSLGRSVQENNENCDTNDDSTDQTIARAAAFAVTATACDGSEEHGAVERVEDDLNVSEENEQHLGKTKNEEKEEEEEEEEEQARPPLLFRDVRQDTRCSICWGTVKNCVTVRVCLHRFCNDCVTESIRKTNLECPECRAKVASRRDFVKDPTFDEIVEAIYASEGGAEQYDEKEEKFSRKEATNILEDNAEKHQRERNRYNEIAEQIKREQHERRVQKIEQDRKREEKLQQRGVQQQQQQQRFASLQDLSKSVFYNEKNDRYDINDFGGHFPEHQDRFGKGTNVIRDDEDDIIDDDDDDDVIDDDDDDEVTQEEYERRLKEVKQRIKLEADAKRMAMMASMGNNNDGRSFAPLPQRTGLPTAMAGKTNTPTTNNNNNGVVTNAKKEFERGEFEAFRREHKMKGRQEHQKVKEHLSFTDIVKARHLDFALSTHHTPNTPNSKESGERGIDEENDNSLVNINNKAAQQEKRHQSVAQQVALRAVGFGQSINAPYENGMVISSAIVDEDFIHITLKRVMGDPLAIAKFEHVFAPKNLKIENLVESFCAQNYFVSAILWKDEEGSYMKTMNEKLRRDNFRFGEEADEVMCSTCTLGHEADKILLCDGCDNGFHCFCLNPKLDNVPEGDDPWYCELCERKKPAKGTTLLDLFKEEIETGIYPLVLQYTGRA
jgi:hypothetical protein